jgi:signal transduction histidine kinase
MSNPPVEFGLDFPTVLASTIHDMKNSLGLVLATLDALEAQRGPRDARQAVHFAELRYESQRLNGQLMQLLAIYKLQQHLYTPNIQQCTLAEVLEEVALEHGLLLAGRDIQIDWQCDEELSGFFDRELIQGVLGNIVNNAFRYARGRMIVAAQPYPHAAGKGVEITLMDDGPGYPEKLLIDAEHAQSQIDFRAGRTGLGLYFCSLVADLHRSKAVHGHIACDNHGIEGGGCFRIFIP